MTAALQRSFSLDGKRVDFSAQTFPLGESPLDREVLTAQKIAALHKIVAQAQLMATNLSYESMAGLTSLVKAISGLRQALAGIQTKTIRAAASKLHDDLNSLKSANPNNPHLALTLSALKNIVPEKTKNGQVIRLAVVRDSKIAQPVLGTKLVADSKPTGAKIITFGQAAAQAAHAERLVPPKPSPLSRSTVAGKAGLSVLAKPELKKETVAAKEPIGKADTAAGRTVSVAAVDKKSSTTIVTQKDGSVVEGRGTSTPAGVKADASCLTNGEVKQTIADKSSLQTDRKVVEGKIVPVNAKAADLKTASVAAEGKVASVAAEDKVALAAMDGVKAIDSKLALAPSAVEGKTVIAAAEAKATPNTTAPDGRVKPTTSFDDNTVHVSTAYTAPASAPPPVAQNGHARPNNSAAAPSAVNEVPTNKSEPVFKPVELVAERTEAPGAPQNQPGAPQNQTDQHQTLETNGTSGRGNAAPASLVAEPIINHGRNKRVSPGEPIREQPLWDPSPRADPITSKQPEPSRVEFAPLNPPNPISGGVAQLINSQTNLTEDPKRDEFKQAAKGVCAGCGGGNCAACSTRPVSADTNSVKNRFTKLDKG